MIETYFEIGYTLVTVLLLGFFINTSLQKKLRRWTEIKWWVLFGFIFNLLSFSWLYTVYPLIWMPDGLTQILGIILLHIILSVSSGLAFVVVGCAFFYAQTLSAHKRPFIVATSFTVAEILRSLFISLLYYGEGTTVDLHFNAGTIGNALSTTPLVELAYYGGTFALTFTVTYLIYAILSFRVKEVLPHCLIITSIFLVTHFFVPTRTPKEDLLIGIVTSDIPTVKDEKLKEEIKESNRLIRSLVLEDTSKKNFIVLPEDSRFLSSLSQKEKEAFETNVRGAIILDGDTIVYNDKLATISLFHEAGKSTSYWRGKEFLLPFNEYIPYFFSAFFGFFVGEELERYQSHHTYSPVQSGKTITFNNTRIGTLICSEILSYRVIERLDNEHPQLIFFQSRLNVFNNSPLFLMHLRSFSKVAAAQLRTPILSSNNYAPSYLINARGSITATIPKGTSYSTVTLRENGGVILNK